MKNSTLIVGAGEVGTALTNVLRPHYPVATIDIEPEYRSGGPFEFMHICFPYSPSFVDSVRSYKALYQPRYTVIHSTVPVGTSLACGAVHSPIRGNHYDMERSLRTLVKFVGGSGPEADAVADYLMRAGIQVYLCRQAETTELGKLLCTTFYGVCIEYIKAAERKCIEEGVPFAEAFTLWQRTYNEGYAALGRPEVARPVLAPIQARIGGHCVLPNTELFDFPFAEIIKGLNRES